MALSSARWPNPALLNNNPFARFTPTTRLHRAAGEPVRPGRRRRRAGARSARRTRSSTVPASMQATTEATNQKWQAISRYETQIDCTNPDEYHVNCGYMRAFVKRSEFFWKYDFGSKRIWPKTVHRAVDVERLDLAAGADPRGPVALRGQRRAPAHDRLRPRAHRSATWTGPTTRSRRRSRSTRSTPRRRQGAAVGLALGWQGHTAWGQPRYGHPGGGLCLYARSGSDPTPFKLQLGYSPGPVDDTTLAVKDDDARHRRAVHDALPPAGRSPPARRATAARCGEQTRPSRRRGTSRRTSRTGPATTGQRSGLGRAARARDRRDVRRRDGHAARPLTGSAR